MPYQEVVLTKYERYVAAPLWAHRRWMEAIESGRQDQHGFDGDGLEAHYWGICGEMAYAKARNVYYEPTFETFKAPDVDGVGVRTRTEHWRELIIRRNDPDDQFFVLVTVEKATQPAVFRVYDGGFWAGEAKKHQGWYKTYDPKRPPCWFVPQSELRARGEAYDEIQPLVIPFPDEIWKES